MFLKSLTVGGFKNLRTTKLRFDHPAIAVISPNNYGKSNLLEAIDFATDFISASPKQRANMMGWIDAIPLTPELANQPFFFEMELDVPELGEYRFIHYGFSFLWYRDDKTGQQIVDEILEMRPTESVRYTSYLKRSLGKYRKGKSTNAFRSIVLEPSVLALDLLFSVDDLEYGPAVQRIRQFEYRVCSTLDVRNQFQPLPFRIADEDDTHIRFDDEDIPRALYQLRELYPDRYLAFEDAVYSLFPEFTSIHIHAHELSLSVKDRDLLSMVESTQANAIPFHLKDKVYRITITSEHLNQPVNLSAMSTGTKRIFWLLTNIFIASCNQVSCIGVEELETSIHPRMLQELLEIISDTLEQTCLIISSHSPYLVQYLKPDQLYAGGCPQPGIAQFFQISPGKTKKLLAAARVYGLSVGEYLFELMCGPESSMKLLRNYLEDV